MIWSWILVKKRSLRFNFFNRLSVNFEKQLHSFVYPYLRFMWAPVDRSLRPYIKNSMFSYGKKKTTAKTVYDQCCSTSDPKRSWSDKINQIENVTVKKTFAGTDQTTRNRVKLQYFDWPIPVFIRFIEISRIYRNIYEVK